MVTLRKPTERACEVCGRRERWSDEEDTWLVDEEAGSVHCVHEWDINGTFLPIEEDARDA